MNSGYITDAIIDRLRHPGSAAVALNQGPRRLRDIEASLRVAPQKIADFAEAFRLVASHGPNTHGLLVILSRPTVSAHVVIISNYAGPPTIIEGQSWGPAYPQGAYTTPAEAEARYGTAVDLRLGILAAAP